MKNKDKDAILNILKKHVRWTNSGNSWIFSFDDIVITKEENILRFRKWICEKVDANEKW